jgi:hypothetical protein
MLISAYLGTWLLFSHFVADFLFQNDWMALNKSKSWSVCLLHAVVYTIVMISIGFAYFPLEIWTFGTMIEIFIFNGICHYIIDFITSRINAYLWKREKRHWFFVTIGVDQFLHSAILIWSFSRF